MKKLLSIMLCLVTILGVAAVTAVPFNATDTDAAITETFSESADAELADTGADAESAQPTEDEALTAVGAEADLQDTGAVTPVNLGDSFYARIRMTKYSDYYVTVPAKETATPILRKLNEYNSQVWHFTREGSTYRIRSVATSRYIEMNGSTVKEGCYLYHTTQNDNAAQKWIITKDSTGYIIHSSIDDNYSYVCVNPTASSSRVVLTTAKNHARSYFNIEKLSITSDLLDTPSMKLSNHLEGVLIDWNDVKSATQYRVYRMNDSTKKWVALADVKKSNYIDKDVKSGTTYQYAVKAISPVLSKYPTGSIKYIAAPEMWVNNTANGPTVCWKVVNGAEKYKVFFHNGTQWKTLGSTTATTFLHSNFEYNREYKYTVRCISADGKSYTSAYNTAGVTNTIVKTPEVVANIMPFSYDLKWARVDGAAKYKVYVKSEATGMKWKEVEDVVENTYRYSDTVSDKGYYFTARALDADGKIISGFKSTKLVKYYEAPCVFDITSTASARKISWYPVNGVGGYRVFKWNGKQWARQGDTDAYTTSLNVPISGSEEQNVCYAVRCLDGNNKFISYYVETVIEDDLRYYFPGEYSSTHKF